MLRPHWRELALCLALVATLQLSGFNVLIYYSVIIFDLAVTDIEPNVATVVSLICLLASYFVVVCYTFRLVSTIAYLSFFEVAEIHGLQPR